MLRPVLAAALLLAAATGAAAQSPLVAELEVVATRYHENPLRLDALRDGLERAVRGDPHVADLVGLARVSFIWGDIRAATVEQKVDAYDRGRQAARRAIERAPRNAAARLRSLFLLPTVQEEIRTILELDPTFTAVYALAGNVFYEVPGLLGGDLGKAEAMFRKGLEQERRELQAVLDERAPTNLADWTLKDSREAKVLLGPGISWASRRTSPN